MRLDPAREHRRRSLGANRDGDRVAVDDRRGDKVALVEGIDHIDQHARPMRQPHHRLVPRRVAMRRIDQCGAGQVVGDRVVIGKNKLAFARPGDHLRPGVSPENRDLRIGFQQQAQLGNSDLASARHNDAPAFQVEKYGKMAHGTSGLPCSLCGIFSRYLAISSQK